MASVRWVNDTLTHHQIWKTIWTNGSREIEGRVLVVVQNVKEFCRNRVLLPSDFQLIVVAEVFKYVLRIAIEIQGRNADVISRRKSLADSA